MTISYDPYEPGFIENPYEQLGMLREKDPVHLSEVGFFFLTRYDHINEALRDDERYSVDHRNSAYSEMMEEIGVEFIPVILFLDPPEHTRLRASLARAFTPATVERIRPRVDEMVTAMIGRAREERTFDFIGDLAYDLPFKVICDLLGIPPSDQADVLGWTSDIVKITEPVNPPDVMDAIASSTEAIRGYLTELLAHKRAEPGDDVMSALASLEGDDGLADPELVDHVMLLNVSAHEPTVNHLGHGLHALLRHPDQRALLMEDASLDVDAAEELLRFEAPLQLTGRFALEDLVIGDREVPAGSGVVMSLAAANHDPAKWGPTADELDLRRPRPHEHLSFARGVHTCFGAALARLQGQAVLGRFVRELPGLELAGEPTWNGRLNARGIVKLPVTVG